MLMAMVHFHCANKLRAKDYFLGWSKHIVFFVEGRKRSSDKTEPAAKCDKAERKMSGC